MARMFQPCPLCGNCGLFRKSERDGNGSMQKPARCASNATPKFISSSKVCESGDRQTGAWFCESLTKKKSGKKKTRKNKPWQDRS